MTAVIRWGILFFLGAATKVFAAPVSPGLRSQYRLVVSGAGPGGLSAALAAIREGVPAREILLVEKRRPDGKPGSYGSRKRVVLLDGTSTSILKSYGVPLPGTPLQTMAVFLETGGIKYFPNRGIWRQVIEGIFGSRSLDRLASLGDIERSLFQQFQRLGGQVVFGETLTPIEQSDSEALVQIGDKKIRTDLLVIFEGARSSTLENIPQTHVEKENTSHFLSLDFAASKSSNIRPGEIFSLADSKQDVFIYGFAGRDWVSVNMMLPRGVSETDLNNPSVRRHYLRLLQEMAQVYGFRVDPADPGSAYSGLLSARDLLRVGSVVFGGDALRTTDAISGTGANVAIQDGALIGLFFRDRKQNGPSPALEHLTQRLVENSRRAFGLSLFFRDLANFNLKHPDFLTLLESIGFSNRSGTGSLLDFGKNFGAEFLSIFTGMKSGNQVVQKIIAGPQALVGLHRPNSAERDAQIGVLHPARAFRPQPRVQQNVSKPCVAL